MWKSLAGTTAGERQPFHIPFLTCDRSATGTLGEGATLPTGPGEAQESASGKSGVRYFKKGPRNVPDSGYANIA
jgi:hypothetical protein